MQTIRALRGAGKLSQKIEIRTHRLVADVSASDGGEDLGPTPHELLAAALGACTSLTVRMYAARKGWPLEDIRTEVKLDHQTGAEGDRSVFTRQIELVGSLDETQRARLLDIANRCPIHKALSGKIEIT